MLKKTFSMIVGLLIGVGLAAQTSNISFSANDIQFWTGRGSNRAVVVIAWDDANNSDGYAPTALAWGVQFSGSITAADALDTIDTYDSRFTHNFSGSFLQTIQYVDQANGIRLTPSTQYNCNMVNGGWGTTYNMQPIANGDLLEISEQCTFSMTTATAVSNPNPPTPPTPQNPVDASIDTNDIVFWTGSGSNRAVFIVNYARPDTAFAWGFRFNGTATAQTMIDSIAAADPNFWVEGSPSMGGDVKYIISTGDTLKLSPAGSLGYNFWWTNLNGRSASSGTQETLHNGDFFKYGDLNSAIGWDTLGTYCLEEAWVKVPTPAPLPIHEDPVVNPTDTTIAASEIRYWIGEGNNSLILSVNWVDSALAWGYRFDADSVTLQTVMNDIATSDRRFSYTSNNSMVNDIIFDDGVHTLRLQGYYWHCNVNGTGSTYMFDQQYLYDGDFVKWGDPLCGIGYDTIGGYCTQYAWKQPIVPVDEPAARGPFCGIVGTEGCNAIAADSNIFAAWATGCSVERGYQDISQASARVTYGSDSNAVGPVALNDYSNVVSLGDGGVATLTFITGISDGEGYDFAVFENGFNDYFLELAFVEVSSDGERFVRFPATSYTQTENQIGSTGRIDATMINNLAGKYRMGYGTPFDLSELRDSAGLDVDHITHIRIIDVVGSIDPQYGTRDHRGVIINDPWPTNNYSGGFDLAGVGVIHPAEVGIDLIEKQTISVYPNPTTDRINIVHTEAPTTEAILFDAWGRQIGRYGIQKGINTIDIQNLTPGIYILKIGANNTKIIKR